MFGIPGFGAAFGGFGAGGLRSLSGLARGGFAPPGAMQRPGLPPQYGPGVGAPATPFPPGWFDQPQRMPPVPGEPTTGPTYEDVVRGGWGGINPGGWGQRGGTPQYTTPGMPGGHFDPGWGIETPQGGPQPTHDMYGNPLGPPNGPGLPPGFKGGTPGAMTNLMDLLRPRNPYGWRPF